jgi:DNA primase
VAKDWVDFRLVKQAVSMQMVLEHYGINGLRKSGNELRGACPVHKGEGSRTFHVNVGKNVFQCFSCKAGGNVLDLVAAIESCTVREAAFKLQAWFRVGESESRAMQPTQEAVVHTREVRNEAAATSGPVNPPLGFQLRAETGHEYGIGRGLTKETLDHFGAGYCLSKGTFAGRFIIPLHNETGDLVGYAGRTIDDNEPKYLFPPGTKGFHKSHLVYNLHHVLQLGSDIAILVEGFFSVMWLYQAGLPQAVGLLGSELSAEQEGILCRHFSRILLLLDGDKAGRAATQACLERLGRRMWVKAVHLGDDLQPDHLSVEEISALVRATL